MKILISRPDKIGDVILALHGAKQLKMRFPGSKVYMHLQDYTIPIVENIKFIDGIVRVGEDIDPYGFDAVVDLMAKSNMALSYYRSNIKIRAGNAARWFRLFYNTTAYIRRSYAIYNEAQYNWKLLSLLDSSLHNTALTTAVDKNDWKDIRITDCGNNYVVIMPGVSASAVPWDSKRWNKLAESVQKHYDTDVYFLLGPAEKKLATQYENNPNPRIKVKSFEEIPALLGFLAQARHYIGPSTGITHIAGTLAIPGVAIFPERLSMHPRRWRPFNSMLKIISMDRKPEDQEILDILDGKKVKRVMPLEREKLSSFVVCCNEESNIRRCLESLKWCDEIVLVDSGSKDRTLEIASEYTDKVYHRKWTGHSDQKLYALNLCSNSWVLNIDSDEEVSSELRGQIEGLLSLPSEKLQKIAGYNLSRVVYFLDKWWERGGWYPEYRLRFFRKELTTWGGVNPHEKAIVKGRVKRLSGDIYHYTYKNFAHQIEALNKHSSASAQNLFRQNHKLWIHNLFLNPVFRFFKFYVMKRGFLEGFDGFLVAIIEANYTFLKYAKLWELNKQAKKSGLKSDLVLEESVIVPANNSLCQIEEKQQEKLDQANV